MSTEQNGVADALHPGYVSPPDVIERAKLRLVTEALTLLALERIEASDVIVAGTSPELHVVVGTGDRIAKWFPPTAAYAPDSPANPRYTCIGKGGEYELIGVAYGAGASRGTLVNVYRDVATGATYFRTPRDFDERMERLS